ncbi:hypothetical protein CYMTET_4503 [Cymbomonas tetramitiformis]|uniref:Uncharacterized protein n=1 Tax=Cymbomonas tetramitiformis TaxID=36881 RepID=A0AAE0H197_9CHLO|nr:hypothetical protein CYMTET_4503 [Cymbomonas tetramitiformis]
MPRSGMQEPELFDFSNFPQDKLVSAAAHKVLMSTGHAPLYALEQITLFLQEEVQAETISDRILQMIDVNLTALEDYIGKAERIRNTTFPTNYVWQIR